MVYRPNQSRERLLDKKVTKEAGKIAWDERGAFVLVTEDFKRLSLGEQWAIMRAAQRAMDRIVMRLTDDLAEENRNYRYE